MSLSNRALFVGWAMALRAMMEAAYASAVANDFAYAGFLYDPSWSFVLLTYGMTFLLALFVPMAKSVTGATVLIFYIVFFVPFGVIASSSYKSVEFYLLATLSMAILIAVARYRPVKPLKLGEVAYGSDMFLIGAFVCLAATIGLFVARGGAGLINFDVSIIYEYRWEINALLTGPLGYLMDWSKNVFLPGLFMFALWKKNPAQIAGATFLFILFFGITSAKTMLAYPLFLTMIYFGVKYARLTTIIIAGATAAVVIPWMAYEFYGQNLFTSATLMRIFYVPPLDTYRYFEFFEHGEKMYMRNTLLGAPFRTHEIANIALVIGENVWGRGSETYTNIGIFGTAYMHFGWVGMIVFPLITGFLLRLLDKLIIGRVPNEIAIPFAIALATNFLSSDLTTTLFSHGLGLAYIVLILIGRSQARAAPRTLPAQPVRPVPVRQ